MRKTDIKIRQMQLCDLVEAMRLKNDAGWNQLEKDWELLIKLAPETCLVAEYNNKIIGTVTAIIYSENIAWIGMMLVDRRFRRKGVGWLLMTTILGKLKKYPFIKLDATPAGFSIYQKLGFVEQYTIHRMTNHSYDKQFTGHSENFPSKITIQDFPKIAKLDGEIFGANRIELIKSLTKTYPNRALLLKRNDKIIGYVLGRTGSNFNQIGPVLALTNGDAQLLISAAMKNLVTKPIVMDILEDKTHLLQWLDSMGFKKERSFIRMYYKTDTESEVTKKYFASCGPEYS